MHVTRYAQAVATRDMNFFSPQRKAIRDSAFRVRMEKFQKLKEKQRERLSARIPVIVRDSSPDVAVKYSNEESLRRNPRLRRMVARPIASLPRKHYLFIKSGTLPLSLEDLSVQAKSIFDESKAVQGAFRDAVASPTDDSWVFRKGPKKGAKMVEWGKQFDHSTVPVSDPMTATPTSLSEVLDVGGTHHSGKKSTIKTDPALLTKRVLGPSESDQLRLTEDTSLTTTATSLITTLRDKAVAFAQTGVNPDLMESIKSALNRYPGLEREQRRKELEECRWTVESLITAGRANTANFNLLIRALGAQKKVEDAFKVHDSMVQLGYTCDADTYVSLIIAAGRDAARARSAYLKMREQLIPPTEKVVGALMKAHVAARDLPAAFALLRKFQDESVGTTSTSPVLYTIVIDGLVKAGKTDLAWNQFHSCRTWRGIKPDAVLFSVMIKACTKTEECEKALGVLDDLRASGEYPTDITYTHLIECMATRADFAPKAFEFWNQMQLEGFEMNPIVAKALIAACGQRGDISRLRRTIREVSSRGIPLTSGMYADAIGTLASGIALAGKSITDHERTVNLRLAWYIVSDLREKGLAVSTPVLNKVMEVYKAAGFIDQTVSMLEQFAQFDCSPDGSSYEILLEVFAGQQGKCDVGRFFALWDFCTEKQISLSPRMFHLALDVALQSMSSIQTVKVLEGMLGRGLRPLPAAAERLAVVGRKIVQIHQVIGRMVAEQRDSVHEATAKDSALLQLDLDEHRMRLALDGHTETSFTTVENEVSDLYWKKVGSRKSPRLPRNEYLEIKKRGGDMHAQKVDKPRANILAE